MDVEECPKLVFGQVDHIDLAVLGGFIKNMTDAGVITTDETLEDFVRELASLPPADEPDPEEDMGVPGTGMTPEDMAAMLAAQQAPPPGQPGGPAAPAQPPVTAGGDAGAGALPAAA
jgi:hypothetical protein